MVNFLNKYLETSHYHPRKFITSFTVILTVFFVIASLIIVNENYKEHRSLLLSEKNEEMDILASLLGNSLITPRQNHMEYIDLWVKGHSEITRVTLMDLNGKEIKSFINNDKVSSTLSLKRNIHLPVWGDIIINAQFNTSKHEGNFIRMGFELFAISLIVAIIFGVLLYSLIYNKAIEPLQKELIREFTFNETILSNIQLGIALIDKDMNLLKANKLIRQWYTNYTGKDLKKCYTCMSSIGNKICQDCPVIKTFHDGQVHETNRSLIIEGEIVYQRIMAVPVFSDNKVSLVIEIVEDITARVSNEENFRRAYRVQKILSQCTQSLIHSENENVLLQNICQIIVDSGYYKLAWIGICHDEDKSVKPYAQAGIDEGFLSNITIKYDGSEYGDFPVGQAVKNNHPQLIQDVETECSSTYWREESKKRGFNSMLCIPLRDDDRVIGTLNIFSEQKYIINEEEINLLIKLADEISYGMHVFRTKTKSKLLLERNINLTQDRDEATIANRKKSDFLAVITHEIRTPLTGILGMTELLLNSSVNLEQEKYLNIIKSTANLQMHIINDILDLSKIENGKLILEKSEFNLPFLIEEVIRSFEWQVREKNLKMLLNYDPDIPDNFIGDSLRIKQIFYNLIGNAVKFTESGGITVLVEKKYQDSLIVKLKITVIDSGIGIALEKQSRIFESYMQADSSISKKYGGTGLGTTITKRLVELMGGSIGLQSPARQMGGQKSEKNQGSEFWFIIDLPISDKVAIDESMKSPKGDIEVPAMPSGLKMKAKILVAEDNEVNQTLIRIMLERLHHQVDIVKNGYDAIEMIKKNQYDFIFMDIEMPELNGVETVKIMRGEYQIKIPVIALTANVYSEDIHAYLAAGMNDIISKPYTQEEIVSKIDKWISTKTL